MKLDIQRFAVTFTGKEATGNHSWAKIQGRVICEETYVGTSTENKSTVKCTVQARVTTGGTTAANWRAGATIGDDEQTGKLTSNTKFVDSWQTIKEFTFDVPHDEDGSKTIEISGYAQAPEYPTSLGDAKSTFSGTMKLTIIPRESSISVNKETATLGDTIRVTINRKSSSFSENLAFILSSPDTGSQNVEAVGVSETYYDYVITEETYKYLTGTQGFLTISGTTLDENDKVVASTNIVSVEILTPDSMIPSVEIGDLYENGSIVPSSWGVFVKGKSEIGIPVSATGVNGSTIKNISMKDSNDSGVYVINSSSGIFSTNKVKSNGTLTITATDTRGKSASKTVEYEVVDYTNPVISTYSAKKVNSEGAEDDNGQNIMFSIEGTISSCGGNNVKKLYVAVNNQTNWISVADDTVDAVLSDTTIDPNVKNTVYFKIEDSLGGSGIKSAPIDSAFRLMNFNKTLTSIALGKKSSASDNEELLEVDMDSKFYKDIEATNVRVNGDITNIGNINSHGTVYGGAFSTGGNISAVGNIKGFINTTTKTLPSGTDGRDYWNYLPNGTYWYANSGSPENMPSSWGWVIKTGFEGSGDFNVMFYTQSSGNIYRKSGNSSGVTGWVKIPLMDDITPVGSVFITSTNTNPSSLGLSGTWELVDKEFSSVGPTNSAFTKNNTNTTAATPYWSRSGHTLNLEIVFTNKVQINDTNIVIGNWDLATLGVTRLNHGMGTCGYTDAGNCMFMGYTNTLGEFSIVDLIPDSYIAAGKTDNKIFVSFSVHKEYMLDSACDRFYWKRIA